MDILTQSHQSFHSSGSGISFYPFPEWNKASLHLFRQFVNVSWCEDVPSPLPANSSIDTRTSSGSDRVNKEKNVCSQTAWGYTVEAHIVALSTDRHLEQEGNWNFHSLMFTNAPCWHTSRQRPILSMSVLILIYLFWQNRLFFHFSPGSKEYRPLKNHATTDSSCLFKKK